ncbi:sugar phosphate nucleotidyltransferase [Paenibacillus sp. MBLB4367]|uniref:sugar phosphate nucleotidyltransferase n=1 Tax=Paenibacillus sp. MBLB4367 TaxID=3384767 RepID=UPI003908197A
MKGIILAGGTGTRLYPLTKIVNKHLLPVGKLPMILYGVNKLREAGIRDVMIVTGKQSAGLFMELLGSGGEWGVSLTYRIQDEAGGIAQALSAAESFIPKGEKFVVMLGDNLFEAQLSGYVKAFDGQPEGAMVLLKQVPDPERYGVPYIENGKIKHIEEKPAAPSSDYCVTGIYLYDSSVFEIIRQIKPSSRGEMEITDVNNAFARSGKLTYSVLEGWWTDAGTFDSLAEASAFMSGSGTNED